PKIFEKMLEVDAGFVHLGILCLEALRRAVGRVYTSGIDRSRSTSMGTTAKLFRNGRSQAVRLPREFRFEGDSVRVRRVGRGVLVEPMFANVADWFAELDRFGAEPFMADGRRQPPTPERAIFSQ